MKKLEKILQQLRKQKLLAVIMGTLCLLSLIVLERTGVFSAAGDKVQAENERICVVIDAGHGGNNLRQQ